MAHPQDHPATGQAQLRGRARKARASLDGRRRQIANETIASTFLRSHFFARAELVGCYLSSASEVDTWAIIARAWRMKKRIFAPVAEKIGQMHFRELTPDSMLRRNRFGLLEPVDGQIVAPERLQIVITPVVAFDENRNRIGMGGGYYDRAFASLKNRRVWLQPKLVGLAFDCQRVEEIAANPWDIRLYAIITETT